MSTKMSMEKKLELMDDLVNCPDILKLLETLQAIRKSVESAYWSMPDLAELAHFVQELSKMRLHVIAQLRRVWGGNAIETSTNGMLTETIDRLVLLDKDRSVVDPEDRAQVESTEELHKYINDLIRLVPAATYETLHLRVAELVDRASPVCTSEVRRVEVPFALGKLINACTDIAQREGNLQSSRQLAEILAEFMIGVSSYLKDSDRAYT